MMFHFLFFTITISKRKYTEKDVKHALHEKAMAERKDEMYQKYGHLFLNK